MAELLPKDTDEEMIRYEEAETIKRYSGLDARNIKGGIVKHDPVRNVEGVYVNLQSGGQVHIGDRPVTPMQVAETNAIAQEQDQMIAPASDAVSASPVAPNGRAPIEGIIGGQFGPQLEDYLAAGYTEQEVQDFQQWDAQRREAEAIQRGDLFPNTLTPEQISQLSQIPGAEMVQGREASLRENIQGAIYNALDPNREPTGPIGDMFSGAMQAIFPDSATFDAGDQRFWSNYLTDFADIMLPVVGAGISVDEGATEFSLGVDMLQQGVSEGDIGKIETGLLSSVIGAGITTLGVVEMVPIVNKLARGGSDALRRLRPEMKNLLADAIGASRAISQGDKDMLLEVFQPRGTPRDLSAAASTTLENTLRQKYPGISIDLSGTAERGYELGRIVIPEGQRQGGIGTRVMQDMTQMADEQGARIFLTPDASFGGTSVSRLKDFYKRFGFVENKGKNKDFSTRNTMYRNPQPRNSPESAAGVDRSYRMQHQPRGPQDDTPVRLDDLTKSTTGEQAGYPEDFYSPSGPRLYAPGPQFAGDDYGKANAESYRIIKSVKGNPDAEVTIYRAVPNDPEITTINEGDFVTLSKTYAELHGASGYGRSGDEAGKVISQKVRVKDIYWDGNDVNEFGYFPEGTADNIISGLKGE